jgi:nucleoside phosphorylase
VCPRKPWGGGSDPYLKQQEKRKSQECDGLFIGEETDYLILASNYEELRAIEDALGPVHDAPIRGDAYKVFFHRRGNDILKIILGFTGQGNLVAAIKTWEAITIWKPREVIFVGVAGGDPLDNNINVGDVIIGEEILAYEHAKVVEVKNNKWKYLPKHRQWPASEVKSKAERLAQKWGKNLPQQYLKPIGREGQNIRAIVQPIASGNKLIVSPSYFTEVGKRTGRSFKAVEMEGDGVCQACNLKGKRALVIRGIMDKCTRASRGDDDAVSRNVNNTMLKGDAYREEIRRAVAGIVASFVRDLLIEKE